MASKDFNHHAGTDKRLLSLTRSVEDAERRLTGFQVHRQDPHCDGAVPPRFAGHNDGMLGSLIMDSMLGGIFSMAVTDMLPEPLNGLDIGNAADMADEFWMDRRESSRMPAERGSLTMAWSRPPAPAPERRALETQIHLARRELSLVA